MKKSELKVIMSELEALGVPDTAVIHILLNDNSEAPLVGNIFKVRGQDASYSIIPGSGLVGSVTQIDAVVLSQGNSD